MYDNPWIYQGEVFDENLVDRYHGFVYCITNLDTGMKYIGKKSMWSKRTLPPLKGQKRKRKKVFESDWREYYGSSAVLNKERARISDDRYKREILRLCKSKGELSYWELKYQMDEDVLLKPDEYYNAFVGGKIHRSHVLKL